MKGDIEAWQAASPRPRTFRPDLARHSWRLYIGFLFAEPALLVLLGSLVLGVSLPPNVFGLAAVFLGAGGAILYYDMP